MKYIIICLLLIISRSESYCQLGYVNGLIITQISDTIRCLVPLTSSFGSKVPIKRTKEGDEENMPVSKIKYLTNGHNVYENISFKKKGKDIHKLMWLQMEGKINLYLETVMNEQNVNPVPVAGGFFTKFGNSTKTYVLRKADTTYLIEQKTFTEIVKPLIKEVPELIAKIESKQYTYDNIEALIKEYNLLVNKN